MAVEIAVRPQPKRLHKHAIMVAMVIVGLTILSIIGAVNLSSQNQKAKNLALHNLTVRIVRIQPNTNGLAGINLNYPGSTAPNPTAGAELDNLTGVGRASWLSIKLEAR